MIRIGYSQRHSKVAVEKALVEQNETLWLADRAMYHDQHKTALFLRCKAVVAHDRTINGLS